MAKSKKPVKRKPVPRQSRKFQLRLDHPVDQHVREVLDFAKGQKREVTMIRDGVRLLWALEDNDLSVLFEMFPHLKPQVASGGGGIDEIKAMLEMIARQQKANTEYTIQSPISGTTTGKQIAAPNFATPVFEDDDELPTMVINKDKQTGASANFLGSLMELR